MNLTTPMDKRVSGVILAAGRSQRMGRPKALLPIFGTTFLEHIVQQVRASRLVDLKIVLGHRPEVIPGPSAGPGTGNRHQTPATG